MKDCFLPTFFLTLLLGLSTIALFNFTIDGDSLYAKKIFMAHTAEIFSSPKDFAVTDIQIDERLLKKQMLLDLKLQNRPDCVIIGSSRAMLISSIYSTVPHQCPRVLNLAVSGAGIEDTLIMAYYISKLPPEVWPKHIYIDLSHWSFRWGEEQSWKILKRDYSKAYAFFMSKDTARHFLDTSMLTNLLSYDYMLHSWQSFVRQGYKIKAKPYTIIEEGFTPENGPKDSAILRDGSRVYSEAQRNAHKNPIIKGTEEYKMSDQMSDPESLTAYKNIAKFFEEKGVDVTFFAMPYHAEVLKKEAPMAKSISVAQKTLTNLKSSFAVPLIGSFYIQETPCDNSEMMDFMHPDTECVSKILNSP
ncbi:MAG: hypothetical protein HYS17_07515 [Micavibrio aeruginosavorus]|uniref:DUF1574 domain-containing protein n=1 Tax=Micavibrio aeruginosavorus TaxID=349221 RepID=A0A7T5R0Q7_9BACT|nr:MAG: hypothetical protein HYS17_07515 [Micavibrio aeruginosavorus]